LYDYKIKGTKYWDEREKGTWADAPKIYDEECGEPFY